MAEDTSRYDESAAGPDAATVWRPGRPVSLSLLLGPYQRGAGDPTQQVDRTGRGGLWRTALTPAGPATVHLAVAADGAVHAAAWGPGAGWLVGQVPALLGADDDPTGFTPQHDLIASTYRRVPHLRLTSLGLVFELLVASVLEQKVTGIEARASWRELVRAYGVPAPGPAPAGMRVFPPASVWRRIPSWEWHRRNVMPQRSRTILRAADVAHRLDESVALPRETRIQRLSAIPGIGPWTVAEIAQRAWGDADLVSVGDFHLAALVGWALVGRPVDDEGMLELVACYPGHRHRAVRLVELSGAGKPKFGPRMTPGDIRAI